MDRRDVLVKCLAVAPLAAFQTAGTDSGGYEPRGNETKQFYALLNEARETFYGGEYARAYRLYNQVLTQIPDGQSSSVLAEIEENRKKLIEILDAAAESLPAHEAAVSADPENADTRFWYTFWLNRAGREEEVFAECQTILRTPGCGGHERACWNMIGRYCYRQGEYRQALSWFEMVSPLDEVQEKVATYMEISEYCKALEGRMLAYAELGMVREAQETVRDYMLRYGRVPSRERRALQKLHIDADAIYIEQCHNSA